MHPTRLKYELAVHIGHAVLHNKDGVKSSMSGWRRARNVQIRATSICHRKIFCMRGAILNRAFLPARCCAQNCHFASCWTVTVMKLARHQAAGVSASVAMRRMTAVSPYQHWHYFDAYTPGKLKAVYRGNGIPLPWGNMRQVEDPCQHWAVFRMFEAARCCSIQRAVVAVGCARPAADLLL